MLSEFADDQLRLLAFSAEILDYRDGQMMFDEGDRADGGMAIASGEVSLQKKGEDGFDVVDLASPGTLLGENAMLVDCARPCRAVAVGDVRVIRVRRALFKRMLAEYPELAKRLFDAHVTRFQETTRTLVPIGDKMTELDKVSASSALRGTREP